VGIARRGGRADALCAPTRALAPEFDEKNKPALVEQPSIRKIEKSRPVAWLEVTENGFLGNPAD
jgi:hypothetical protein